MKNLACFLCIQLTVSLACSISSAPSQGKEPGISTIVAETMQAIPTEQPILPPPVQPTGEVPTLNGTEIITDNIYLVIPSDIAAGATVIDIAPLNDPDLPPWDITPGHVELTFNSYALQNRFHEPKIYIFPAPEYAALLPGAAQNILLLQDVLSNPAQLLGANNMPSIPFFNAGAVFIARDNIIHFQNGSGVVMLTQYAQSFAQVNNQEMFYHFQGLTSDGQYYLIAILPISAPILAENWEATAPPDGVPFPGYADPDVDFQTYYDQVIAKLNTLPEDTFNPSITKLDTLIGSIQISP